MKQEASSSIFAADGPLGEQTVLAPRGRGGKCGEPCVVATEAARRVGALQDALDSGRYFKVVCGAGNEDPDEVYRLSLVYTLAGALGIDVSANVDVVRAAVRGIDKAFELAPALGSTIELRPFITVSVGLKGDPHVRKARIDAERCAACGECLENCPQEAIEAPPFRVLARRCIGCGRCAAVCDSDAVEFNTRRVDLNDILPKCIEAGAESVELHATVQDDEAVMRDWRVIADVSAGQFVSMCLDRSHLSNTQLSERVRRAEEVAGDRLIIQADGAPMSGGADDYNTTLQAVDCADVIQKSGVAARILLSGGTNSKTAELAALCGVAVSGVSIGTFARNLVRSDMRLPDFDSDLAAIGRAVAKARWLVNANIEQMRRPRDGGGSHCRRCDAAGRQTGNF